MSDEVITVIIAAYGRRTFLKEAIASALDQTLPRSKYEIVVIKNFRDKDIDSP
ncbi:MAG: glycosyltransferase family 2 protein [Candidatus Parvarchaeota archaeon]|nr:glycosyltransferase family 2 protein [Candidatus Parvarchaeota archaeon]